MRQKVLIVDDDHSFRAFERAALERHGYDVAEAEDGLQAMKLAKTRLFDLIVLDIYMPNLEGLETLRQIRQLLPDLPVITISGGGAIHNYLPLRSARLMGAQKVIEKPVTMGAFLRAVKETLAAAS